MGINQNEFTTLLPIFGFRSQLHQCYSCPGKIIIFNMIEIQCVSSCVISNQRHLEMIYLLMPDLCSLFSRASYLFTWTSLCLLRLSGVLNDSSHSLHLNYLRLKWANVCSLSLSRLSNASLHSFLKSVLYLCKHLCVF